jgi:hypothetical protein
MSLSVVLTIRPLASGQPVTTDDVNALVRSITAALQGGVDASILADESVGNNQVARNAIDLSQRALDLSLSAEKIKAGAVTAAKATADAFFYGAAVLTAGVYVVTLSASTAPAAYAAGQFFFFKADVANTGATDIQIGSLAAKNLLRPDGSELAAGDIKAGQLVMVQYDGTQFQLLSALYQMTKKWVEFQGNNKTTGVTFTVNTSTNVATATAHGMTTGQALTVTTATTLPAPLAYTTVYFARVLTADTFTFHLTAADANANTNIVDLTTTGTGTHTLWYCLILASQGIAAVIRTPGAGATTAPVAGEYTVQFTDAFTNTRYCCGLNVKSNAGTYPLANLANVTESASEKALKCAALTSGSSTITDTNFIAVHFTAEGA